MKRTHPMKETQLIRTPLKLLSRGRGKAEAAYLAAALLTGSFSGVTLPAQDSLPSSDELRALRQRVEELEQKLKALESRGQTSAAGTNNAAQLEELDQKVKVLERNRELEQEAVEAKAKEAPKITIGASGFGFASADGNFGLQLKGVLQVDSRTFFDAGDAGNDGILLRRARPILQGTVFRDFDFLFVPDFGGSSSPQIYDAYLNYRYVPARFNSRPVSSRLPWAWSNSRRIRTSSSTSALW